MGGHTAAHFSFIKFFGATCRDRTDEPSDYESDALPTELRWLERESHYTNASFKRQARAKSNLGIITNQTPPTTLKCGYYASRFSNSPLTSPAFDTFFRSAI